MGEGTPGHQVILNLRHESKLLGILPLRKPLEGELVTLSLELYNRSPSDIPGSEAEIVILWPDGEGARPPLKVPIEPIHPGERATIGPRETPVGKAGVARVYLRLVTWPGISPQIFQDSHGRPLVYNQQQNWIPVGRFRTSSRQLLYRQILIGLGIASIVVAVIISAIALAG